MTTLLTKEQTQEVKSVGNAALVLIVLSMIDANFPGRATRAAELLPYLYPSIRDIRKVEAQLDSLCACGITTQTRGGYVLLSRALLLGTQQALALSPENSQALPEALALPELAEPIEQNVENVVIQSENRAQFARALGGRKEEESNLKIQDSYPPPNPPAQNARTNPTTKQILDATPALFGSPGVLAARLDLDALEPSLVLGWLAHAWNARGQLDRPAALVHSRLTDPKGPRPRSEYLTHPESYLPREFLAAIGLASDHRADDEPVSAEKTARTNAEEIWKRVKDQLQREMPRSIYHAFVDPTEAVSLHEDLLLISCADISHVEWLQSRLTSTVRRLLVGILNREVDVEFKVSP